MKFSALCHLLSCSEKGLGKSETGGLMEYLKQVLAGKCFAVKSTPRLVSHPCVVTVEEMASARHFVKTQFSQVRWILDSSSADICPIDDWSTDISANT